MKKFINNILIISILFIFFIIVYLLFNIIIEEMLLVEDMCNNCKNSNILKMNFKGVKDNPKIKSDSPLKVNEELDNRLRNYTDEFKNKSKEKISNLSNIIVDSIEKSYIKENQTEKNYIDIDKEEFKENSYNQLNNMHNISPGSHIMNNSSKICEITQSYMPKSDEEKIKDCVNKEIDNIIRNTIAGKTPDENDDSLFSAKFNHNFYGSDYNKKSRNNR